MAIVTIDDRHLYDISDAIREKHGFEGPVRVEEMKGYIEGIPSGSTGYTTEIVSIGPNASKVNYVANVVSQYADEWDKIVAFVIFQGSGNSSENKHIYCYFKDYSYPDENGIIPLTTYYYTYYGAKVKGDTYGVKFNDDGTVSTYLLENNRWGSISLIVCQNASYPGTLFVVKEA